jgi:uncharacterized membrane protein
MPRVERVARWVAIACTVAAIAILWVAGAIYAVIFGMEAGGWNWWPVVVVELFLLAFVALIVSWVFEDRRDDRRTIAEANAKIQAANAEIQAKLHLVDENLDRVKRDLSAKGDQ